MNVMWSLWVVPMIVVSTFVHGVVSNVWSLFDRTPGPQLRVARAWARSLLWIAGVKVEIEGLEHIRVGGNYVFVANHVSYMDTPVVLAHVPEQFLFLAKSGLFKIPLLGWHLHRAGHVPVPLEDVRGQLKTLQKAAALIREGRSTLVFPEGGRSESGKLREFKDGAAYLAIRARVPLVPMALIGMRGILPMHSLRFHPGRVKLKIGEPIPTDGLSIKERQAVTTRARERVVELLERP